MKENLKILLLEDSNIDAEMTRRLLRKSGVSFEDRQVMSKEHFEQSLGSYQPDVILADNELPEFNAAEALDILRRHAIHTPFILVTGTMSEEFAVSMIKKGADDYILKDRPERLPAAIEAALKQRSIEREKDQAVDQIRQSEEQYRSLVERVSDGFISLDNELNFTYVNKVAALMFGRPADYLLGKNMWKEFPAAIDKPFYTGYYKALQTQANVYVEDYSAAIHRYVQASIYPSPTGLSVYFKDVTEKIRMQEKLFEREGLLELFIQYSPVSLAMFDRDMRYIAISNRWLTDYGLRRQDIIGKTHYDVFPEIKQEWIPIHQRCMLGAIEKSDDDLFIRADGTPTWLRWEIHPWHKASGEVGGIIIFTEDITERKSAEEEIAQSEERLKQAQSIAHIGSWEHDLSTNEVRWSDETYRIYGLEPQERKINFADWLSFVHPEDLAPLMLEVEKSRVQLQEASLFHRIIRPNGETRHMHSLSRYEFDANGKATVQYGIAHDITEKKKLELELQEQHRLEQLKLTDAALAAQEKERNAIAIELHDNVNQILVGTKLLLSMAKTDPSRFEHLVVSSMDNLQNAIDENRKISHALVTPDFDTIPFNDQLRHLAGNMLGAARIDVLIRDELFCEKKLTGDQLLASYRIMQEQFTNIVKYARAKNVTITLATVDGEFRMQVSDDGTGAGSAKVSTGIGLKNIKSRLAVLGGKAVVVSSPGKGFTLDITMPLTPGQIHINAEGEGKHQDQASASKRS
jgi:PAS domain S-box-containing protein